MISTLLAQRSFWLESPGSTSAQNHDTVFYTLLYVMAFFFVLVTLVMLAFVVIYRRRRNDVYRAGPTHNAPLEIFWTVVPLAIVIGFFVFGLHYYVDIETPPAGADVVDVEARQWGFTFRYPNGAESEELYLLVDRPVVFRLTSRDVSHSLFIPDFRLQRNAVPGRTTQFWVTPTEKTEGKDPATGEDKYLEVYCTQYCGQGHSEMRAKAYVLDKEDYDKKLKAAANIFLDKEKKPLAYVEVGKKLYHNQGCFQCHSVNGTAGTGPTWKGLYKSSVAFSESNVPGFTLSESDDDAKWDAYLRESILHPEVKIVRTFLNQMPPQESVFDDPKDDQLPLSKIVELIEHPQKGPDAYKPSYKTKKLVAVIEYIKSLGDSKYYHPMPIPPPDDEKATDEKATDTKAPAAKAAPALNGAKPHAEAAGAKAASGTASPAKDSPAKDSPAKDSKAKDDKSTSQDHRAARPANEPVDHSAVSPAAKETGK